MYDQCELFLFCKDTKNIELKACACACTSQDEYCATELCLSVDKLRKKKNEQQRRQQQEDTVLVYRCQCLCSVQSVTCAT